MKNHTCRTLLSFEDKVKLLDKAEKACTEELIDRLMAERHGKQQPMPNDGEWCVGSKA